MRRAPLSCAITGVGYSEFSRESRRSVLDLAVTSIRNAIADAGLTRDQIDGLVCYHENDSAFVRDVATALGLRHVSWYNDLLAGGFATCLSIADARNAIESGMARNVVCYRAMNGRSGFRMGEFALQQGGRGLWQYFLPHGFGNPPQIFAMVAQRYMHEFSLTQERLGEIAVTQRNHASINPRAMRRDPITIDDYLASRSISTPLKLLDCCQETDGAVAVIVSGGDQARDLAHQPVEIAAITTAAPAGARPPLDQWKDITELSSRKMREALWGRAGIGPGDVDVALIYDAFSIFVLLQLEELGFCKRGEAGDFIAGGRIAIGGDLPINPHGGMLSEAYIHGMNNLAEAIHQLRGTAGERQVADAEHALVTGFGAASSAMVLRRPQ